MTQGATARTRRQVLIVATLAVAVAAFLSVAAIRHGFFDLQVYYGAMRYWVLEDGLVYDWLKGDSKYGFTYPPFAALVMLPMAYLSWPLAIVVNATATVLAGALLLYWLVDPIARRMGWTRWFAFAVAVCLAAAFEPMRETFTFGQVNLLLLFLVAVDLLFLVARGSRWAGVAIGLATAIKLTPGIFILYLLVTRRWRAAAVAAATATAATLLTAAVAVDESREFWTSALWNIDRVGSLAFVSNQSWQGVVARLAPTDPSITAWLALVGATLVVWAWRSRAAVRAGDEATGLALTGVAQCLVSPVTWVHHLVWLLPALVLLADNAFAAPAGSRRRRYLLAFAIFAYGLLISRLVWAWEFDFTGVLGFLGSNAYVWVSVALLVLLPVRDPSLVGPAGVPHLGKLYNWLSRRTSHDVRGSRAVGH
jgi:alpha-1,2-mannosyltransferase